MDEEICLLSDYSLYEINSPQFKKELQELVDRAMSPLIEDYQELEFICNNLQGIIQSVMERNQFNLNGRYNCRIQRALSQLAKVKKQVDQINYSIQRDPTIYNLQEEIEGFKKQIEVLGKNKNMLVDQMISLEEVCSNLKKATQEQSIKLKQLNRENLKLNFIEFEIQSQANTERIHFKQQESTLPTLPKIPNDVIKLRSSINNCKIQNSKIRNSQSKFIYMNRTNEEIFQNCFKAAEQELLKSQKTIKSKQGLFGSLYFQLINSKKKEEMKIKSITSVQSPSGLFSPLVSKTPKDTLYDTFKNMALTSRDHLKKQELITLNISFEEFKNFTPFQVLGLLSLRPDVVNALHQYLFPNNFLMKQSPPLKFLGKIQSSKNLQEHLKLKEQEVIDRITKQYNPNERISTIS